MYFPKIKKTTEQLEVMIQALEMQYGANYDTKLAYLMAKYFEVNEEDAMSTLRAYRGHNEEDYEQQSKRVEYASL
jgi:hypothetical protein